MNTSLTTIRTLELRAAHGTHARRRLDDKRLVFISVNVTQETREAETATLDALRAKFEAKGVPVKEGWGDRSS